MKILFVCDERPHAHDYGVDFLIQGAYGVLGAENVHEWPEKPNLHLAIGQDRDECQIDSDAWLPSKRYLKHDVEILVRDGLIDLIILTSAYGTENPLRQVCSWLPDKQRIVGLHYDDETVSTWARLEQMVGSSVGYFHREHPPTGAHPLLLTQPLSRVRLVEYKPNLRDVFYHGTTHWPDDQCPRRRMLTSITLQAHGDRNLVLTQDQQTERLRPEAYRERLYESAVSVVWNSGPNFPVWGSNRFAESLALGCAVVAERPPYKLPRDAHSPCITWVDRPEDVGVQVRWLLDHPDSLRASQRAGQEWFVRYGSSEAQLRRILTAVGLPEGDDGQHDKT